MTHRRVIRLFAFIMLAGLVTAACGARLAPNVRARAASAILGENGSGGSGTTIGGSQAGGTPGGSTTTGGGSATTGGGSTTKGGGSTTKGGGSTTTGGGSTTKGGGTKKSGGTTTSSTAPSTGDTTSASSGTSCPTGGTDVGLTSNSINLGTVADVTGPVNGLFTGAEQGIETWAAYVNDNGGLCGHKINIDFADGGTNCSTNENDVQTDLKRDFAMVGTFSLYDGCGADVLKNTDMPDIHVALDPAAGTLSNHFDLEPGGAGYQDGPFKYYAQKLGASAVQHVGTISEDIPSAQSKQDWQVKAAEDAGWKFVYQNAASPTDSNFTSNFQTMCQKDHIKVFFTVTEDAQNAATMIENENQAGCTGITNIIPIAYDQSFTGDYSGSGSSLNTVYGWNEYSLFYNQNEAANIPALATFQQWFNRIYPGQALNLYAMFAWVDGMLFEQAYQSVTGTMSRKAMLTALGKVKNFSGGGIIAPTDPASKGTGDTCFIVWHLSSNGQFSRMSPDPKSGYICNSKFIAYG